MRINFFKIDVGGRELLNVKMEKRTTHQYSLPDHWADLTVMSVWNEEKKDEMLCAVSPWSANFNINLKHRTISLLFEFVFELCRGSAEIGFKLNVMQDSDKERQPLNP